MGLPAFPWTTSTSASFDIPTWTTQLPRPSAKRRRANAEQVRGAGRFASARRLGTPGLEVADLALRVLVAEGVTGLQLGDEDLAATVDLLNVVVGQPVPLLLDLVQGLGPALEFCPRPAGFLFRGRGRLCIADGQRHRRAEGRRQEDRRDQAHHRSQCSGVVAAPTPAPTAPPTRAPGRMPIPVTAPTPAPAPAPIAPPVTARWPQVLPHAVALNRRVVVRISLIAKGRVKVV